MRETETATVPLGLKRHSEIMTEQAITSGLPIRSVAPAKRCGSQKSETQILRSEARKVWESEVCDSVGHDEGDLNVGRSGPP
jgi:hypothetical protein